MQLKTFIWVHRLGGFRRAAEKLNTTQPAISSRIAALEEALGVKLIDRGPGGIQLTPKGYELLGYAQQVADVTDLIESRVGDAAQMSGVLRFGVSETIVQSWLSRFLARLSTAHPKIEVELTVDVSVTLRDALINRSLDLAFLMGPVSEYTVTNLPLPEFELSWYMARDLLHGSGDAAPGQLFAAHPIITYARNTRPYSEIKAEVFERHGIVPRMFASSSLAACMQMVRQGVGIGTLPVRLVGVQFSDREVERLDLGWDPRPLQFTASFVSDPPNFMARSAAELAQKVADEFESDKISLSKVTDI
ncbi:MAG: LysR family transcriptional regulator [Hyphomicrobiales bacterium]